MSQLRMKVPGQTNKKAPLPGSADPAANGNTKAALPRDSSAKSESTSSLGLNVHALNFGTLHTKSVSSSQSSGSQWSSLINSATSGSGILGGGLLSSTGFGLVSGILGLFGIVGSSAPTAPVAFQIPKSQQQTLDVSLPGSGVAPGSGLSSPASPRQSGIYQQTPTPSADSQGTQHAQVVQIVKQALLTSSSLNDVIAEV
jgi:hypothetical protein